MTTKKSFAKRMLALAMMLIVAMTLIVPVTAFAAGETETYTITIVPNDNTLTPGKSTDSTLVTRFTAYAIFAGDLAKDYNGGNGVMNPPNVNQLADVKWGSGIKTDAYSGLLAALCNSDVTLEQLGLSPANATELNKVYGNTATTITIGTTLGTLFRRGLENESYGIVAAEGVVTAVNKGTTTDESLASTAAVIAKVISAINATQTTDANTANNQKLANAFAAIVAKATAPTTTSGKVYEFLTNGTDSTWVDKDAAGESLADPYWQIDGLSQAGYYLIVDNYNASNPDSTTEQDEISRYMLAVFGSQTIRVKSEGTSVDKEILQTKDANGDTSETDTPKGASAGIGDTVTFKLTGHLPENFSEYSKFAYTFHDTMSAGLTFNKSSVAVKAKKSNPKFDENEAESETNKKYLEVTIPAENYTVTEGNDTSDTCTFHVHFANLLAVKDADGNALTNEWFIEVRYDATVNENAVVVDPKEGGTWTPDDRNNNKVQLEYSNDVNDENSTAKTPEETVYVYVFGLDVDKVDGTTSAALKDAGFTLSKTVSDVKYYAVFQKTGDTYTVVKWMTAEEIDQNITVADDKDVWKDGFTVVIDEENPDSNVNDDLGLAAGDYVLVFTTLDSLEAKLLIKGLDEGTYTLSEMFTPSGYDTMKDVEFTITPEIEDGTNANVPQGALTKLEAETTEDTEDAQFTSPSESGYIPVTLRNMPAGYLPGTGGMGTVLFYVGGFAVLALGFLHIMRYRNKKTAS